MSQGCDASLVPVVQHVGLKHVVCSLYSDIVVLTISLLRFIFLTKSLVDLICESISIRQRRAFFRCALDD